MLLLCIQEHLLFWESFWSLQKHLLCPVLHVLEHSRANFEISFLRHRRAAFLPYPGCNGRGWHGPAPLIPHKGSSWEVNKAIRQRAPAWCNAGWKEQSRTALLTGSDIPITFSLLHPSLLACTPQRCQQSHFTITLPHMNTNLKWEEPYNGNWEPDCKGPMW